MATTAKRDEAEAAGSDEPRLRRRFVEYAFTFEGDGDGGVAAVAVAPGTPADLAAMIAGLPDALARVAPTRAAGSPPPDGCSAYAQTGSAGLPWEVIVRSPAGRSKVLEGVGGADASACFNALFRDTARRRDAFADPHGFAEEMAAWRPVLCAPRVGPIGLGGLRASFDDVMGALAPIVGVDRAGAASEGSSP